MGGTAARQLLLGVDRPEGVFTLRRILAAAVADRRLAINAAENVPLPVDEPGEQRFLTADEIELLADAIDPRFRAMVLVAAYGGCGSAN